MKSATRYATLLTFATLLCCGCSSSDVEQIVDDGDIAPLGVAAIAPSTTIAPSAGTASKTDPSPKSDGGIPEFKNPFAPPKTPPKPVIKKPKKKAPPKKIIPKDQPAVRLLGFMAVDEPKAMLSIHGESLLVAVGDKVTNWTVVSVESPALVMEWADEEMRLELFDQEWEHAAKKFQSGSRSTRPVSRSTSKEPRPRSATESRSPSLGAPSSQSKPPAADSGTADLPRLPGDSPSGPQPEVNAGGTRDGTFPSVPTPPSLPVPSP